MKRRKKTSKKTFLVIPAILILAGGITCFYILSRSEDKSNYQAGVDRIAQLEATDIAPVEQQLQELKQKDKEAQISQVQEGISEEQGILSDIEIKQVFQGSVIIGDSITESIMEYGFLDTDVVISKRGLSIADAGEQIQTAINLHPHHVFLAFGTNDLEIYEADSASFIDAYRSQLQKIQEALPDAPVYINGVLPPTQAAMDAIPALTHYPEYNQGLQALCEEMGCTFIDNSFIVQNNESMYEPDGEHVIRDYYPKWLTYMAETAGL